jgi:hypothetical protein
MNESTFQNIQNMVIGAEKNLNYLWELKKKKYFLGRRRIIPPNANIDPSLKLKISYIPIMMMVCTKNVY